MTDPLDDSDGDEWKRQPAVPFVLIRCTRAEAQARLDAQYAAGLIDRATWRFHTDLFGEMQW